MTQARNEAMFRQHHAINRYKSGYRYVQWAHVVHRLKPNGLTACGETPGRGRHGERWLDDEFDEHAPSIYFCRRCAHRVAVVDPISGVDYEHGRCENCDCWSVQLVPARVESGAAWDTLLLCPPCRNEEKK